MSFKKLLIPLALFYSQILYSQDLLLRNLKQHISVLAADSFEGRETGTHGEQLSYEYIQKQFKEIGLEPKGTEGYLQSFTFTRSTKPGKNNILKINGASFNIGTQFYPLAYAANASGRDLGSVVQDVQVPKHARGFRAKDRCSLGRQE